MKFKILLTLFFMSCNAMAAEDFSSMKEAKIIADYYKKFSEQFTECTKAMDAFNKPKPDMTDAVAIVKRECNRQRFTKLPIPDEIKVSQYATIEQATSCLVDQFNEVIRGLDGRLRIDSTKNISEEEKVILRKNLAKPLEEIYKRCSGKWEKSAELERAAIKATLNFRSP